MAGPVQRQPEREVSDVVVFAVGPVVVFAVGSVVEVFSVGSVVVMFDVEVLPNLQRVQRERLLSFGSRDH